MFFVPAWVYWAKRNPVGMGDAPVLASRGHPSWGPLPVVVAIKIVDPASEAMVYIVDPYIHE